MKRLLALLVFLAVPGLAQVGDCVAETGWSTTWEVIDPDPVRPTIRYTFYTGGLSGYQVLDVRRPTGGMGLVAFAELLCSIVEESKTEDEVLAARNLVRDFASDAGLVLPAFPEVCVPRSPAVDVVECRQQRLHESVLRDFYPLGGPSQPNRQERYQAAVDFAGWFGGIYEWLTTPAPQGGRGLNDNGVNSWLGAGPLDHQRMNNFGAIISALETDVNNFPDRGLQ